MDSATTFQLKANAFEIIKNYRVPDLQALLKYARLSQQGNKRELLQRCKILISSSVSSQLLNKINQIEITRINATKSHHASSSRHATIVPPPPPPPLVHSLPSPSHIQYVHLPFFEKMRTIESLNIPIDWNTFPPLRFTLTDFDTDLILKRLAKVFLRIVPTTVSEKQNDVLPPYLFIQCNGQIVINNNISKTMGSQAHSVVFPTDITDKLIPKSTIENTLSYLWLQSPVHMSFKNLPKSYTISIQLLRCISLDNLVHHILKRESQQINSNGNDSDIEIEDIGLMATRHRVSLLCPITQSLILIPVKSSYCSHLTCFDLRPFLQMNEKRLQWTCPICKKSAAYETLHVDKRLETILANVPANCSTVEIDSATKILSDCQYIIDHIKQEKTDIHTSTTSHDEESIHNSPKSRRQSSTSDCIVLSSESESEENDLFHENSVHSLQSLFESNVDDGTYWEDIARITYDLMSDNNNNNNQENLNRKRSHSSSSSLLSNNDNPSLHHHQQKRMKSSSINQSQTGDIELITLSSNDSSDNDDQLF